MKQFQLPLVLVFLLLITVVGVYAEDTDEIWQAPPPREFALTDGAVLFYDENEYKLWILYPNGKITRLHDNDMETGSPAVSPDKTRVSYLNPYGWEEYSGIYIFDAGSGQTRQIHVPNMPQGHTPKQVLWLNDTVLLVIIGYCHGTITAGGDLYFYDVDDGRSAKIVAVEDMEINSVSLNRDNAYLFMIGK